MINGKYKITKIKNGNIVEEIIENNAILPSFYKAVIENGNAFQNTCFDILIRQVDKNNLKSLLHSQSSTYNDNKDKIEKLMKEIHEKVYGTSSFLFKKPMLYAFSDDKEYQDVIVTDELFNEQLTANIASTKLNYDGIVIDESSNECYEEYEVAPFSFLGDNANRKFHIPRITSSNSKSGNTIVGYRYNSVISGNEQSRTIKGLMIRLENVALEVRGNAPATNSIDFSFLKLSQPIEQQPDETLIIEYVIECNYEYAQLSNCLVNTLVIDGQQRDFKFIISNEIFLDSFHSIKNAMYIDPGSSNINISNNNHFGSHIYSNQLVASLFSYVYNKLSYNIGFDGDILSNIPENSIINLSWLSYLILHPVVFFSIYFQGLKKAAADIDRISYNDDNKTMIINCFERNGVIVKSTEHVPYPSGIGIYSLMLPTNPIKNNGPNAVITIPSLQIPVKIGIQNEQVWNTFKEIIRKNIK